MDIQLEFAHAVGTGDGTLNVHLDRAALLVAAAASGPEAAVDIDLELARLDALATGLDATNAAELALELFGGAGFDPELHFGGNHRSYYEVQNSLLPMVLDRRVGIPISLAVLMIEIGRRRAIDLHGVGMPGHFLVGSAMGYIDVFNGGVLLDVAGCEGLFQQLAGPGQRLPENALARTPDAMIIRRMLLNLAMIATNQGLRRTLWAIRSLQSVFPDATHRDHVQHAFAAAQVGQFSEAAHAGERALVTAPSQVHEKLNAQIATWRARLN